MILHEVVIRGALGNKLFGLFYAYKISQKFKIKVSLYFKLCIFKKKR